jgi:hypothetical protein
LDTALEKKFASPFPYLDKTIEIWSIEHFKNRQPVKTPNFAVGEVIFAPMVKVLFD